MCCLTPRVRIIIRKHSLNITLPTFEIAQKSRQFSAKLILNFSSKEDIARLLSCEVGNQKWKLFGLMAIILINLLLIISIIAIQSNLESELTIIKEELVTLNKDLKAANGNIIATILEALNKMMMEETRGSPLKVKSVRILQD